jgi:hypothetical protein
MQLDADVADVYNWCLRLFKLEEHLTWNIDIEDYLGISSAPLLLLSLTSVPIVTTGRTSQQLQYALNK